MITVSIVSHNQAELVVHLLGDLARHCNGENLEVILTVNVPEAPVWTASDWPFPLRIVRNDRPQGFGANHNQAFGLRSGSGGDDHLVVMNPDVRLLDNPFPVLIGGLQQLKGGVIASAVVSANGGQEDSIRRFPTLKSLILKALSLRDGRYVYQLGSPTFKAEWVAGMFMLFRAADFQAVGGFDEKFFMYYEDVDICTRLWKAGYSVLACPKAQVIHDARRTSRKSLRYMRWHVASMVRYFWKHWYRLPRIPAS